MLINLRNALMAGKRLPYDAEVEYLESTGTQWIDTGIIPTSSTIVSGEFRRHTQHSDWRGLLGSGAGARSGDCFCIGLRYNNGYVEYFIAGSANQYVFTANNERFLLEMSISRVRVVQNGIEYVKDTGKTSLSTSIRSINIFRVNNSDANLARPCSYDCFGFKIYDGATLVRDYIPVRVGTTGYLYDRVSGALFGNAGTGDFVLGPDVVPVEYIESHGTEWIDTGVIGNSSTKVELKAQGTNTSSLQVLLGGRDTNGLYSFAVWQRSTLGGTYGMRWDYLATNTGGGGGGYLLDGVWNTSQPNLVVKDGANNYLNGVQLGANASNSFSCNFPLALFAMNTGGSKGSFFVGKMFMCKIFNNNTPTRNYTPVRVGTEGAMMDTLTRRIYRNAGTGAFTYGNDLKYPIPA